jgi:hypothetical protein
LSGERVPVVQYVQMSTDHQRYSTANQRMVIEAYASRHGMEIVETFEDQGKSGLHLDSRIGDWSGLSGVGHSSFRQELQIFGRNSTSLRHKGGLSLFRLAFNQGSSEICQMPEFPVT